MIGTLTAAIGAVIATANVKLPPLLIVYVLARNTIYTAFELRHRVFWWVYYGMMASKHFGTIFTVWSSLTSDFFFLSLNFWGYCYVFSTPNTSNVNDVNNLASVLSAEKKKENMINCFFFSRSLSTSSDLVLLCELVH